MIPQVEITGEPHHHLIFQNEWVRVFDVVVAPHDGTLMHRHGHDYIYVMLGPAVISNLAQGKPPVEMTLAEGDVQSVDRGLVHLVRNTGNTTFHNITVEFLQDEKMHNAASHWDNETAISTHGGAEEVLFVKDGVRVSRVELQTAGFEAQHHHTGPHLVIAITDLTLRAEAPDKTASNIDMKAGEVKWVGGNITHTVTNVGREPAKLVSVEF